MGLLELFILAVGLSMDAFAVSVCKGLAMPKISVRKAGIVGLWFGGFQALMPAVGYLLGYQFRDKITAIDHWIAFLLLGIIGANMIREAIKGEEEDDDACNLALPHVLMLAVATSIDALAVGITFAFLKVNILSSILIIGLTTFALSFAAVYLGSKLGDVLKRYAGILGGVILIVIGTKILIEHLFF